jgi:hypothetical protein
MHVRRVKKMTLPSRCWPPHQKHEVLKKQSAQQPLQIKWRACICGKLNHPRDIREGEGKCLLCRRPLPLLQAG